MDPDIKYLSMIGHGTFGSDGIDEGIHLRWSFEDKLGFPPCFKLYRRISEEGNRYHLPLEETPLGDLLLPYQDTVIQNDKLIYKLISLNRNGNDAGYINVETFEVPGGNVYRCLHISNGELTIQFSIAVSRIELLLYLEADSTMTVTCIEQESNSLPYKAFDGNTGVYLVSFDAPGTRGIIVEGTNIRILALETCIAVEKGGEWERINNLCGCGLPVNQDGTAYTNDVYHNTGKDLAMALCRLGFRNVSDSPITALEFLELKGMLLTMTGEGMSVPVGWNVFPGNQQEETDTTQTVTFSKYDFLLTQSLQVFFAKILGLYFVDPDVDNDIYYDYKITAEWPEWNMRRLDHEIIFDQYNTGDVFNPIQQLNNHVVLLAPSRPVISADINEQWRTEKGVEIISENPLVVISFLKPVTEVQLVLYNPAFASGNPVIEIEAYRNLFSVYTDKVTLMAERGMVRLRAEQIDSIRIYAGQVIITRIHYDFEPYPGGLQSYIITGLTKRNHLPLQMPTNLISSFIPGGTISNNDGSLTEKPYMVGLRWDANEDANAEMISIAPVLYHVERKKGNSAVELITKDAPLFISPIDKTKETFQIPIGWPQERQYLTDEITKDIISKYRVAALDLFGRQSNFTPFATYEITLPKPPHPKDVSAQFLDFSTYDPVSKSFADTTIKDIDKEWLKTNQKNAIAVRWSWPENFQLQAPEVEGFSIYFKRGWLNNYTGIVTSEPEEKQLSKTSLDFTAGEIERYPILATLPETIDTYKFNITVPVIEADSYRLCWLTQANHSFLILKNNTNVAPAVWILKLNDRPINDQGFSIAVTGEKSFFIDYKEPPNWELKLHDELKHDKNKYTVYIEDPDFPAPALTAEDTAKVAYAQVGVNSYTPGVTGSVSPPATIMAIYRQAPASPVAFLPLANETIQALKATPANVHGKSSFALRWKKTNTPVSYKVLRALDETLFNVDNKLRLTRSDSVYETFKTNNPLFNAADVDEVKNIPQETNSSQVAAHYRALTPGQLQVLASLPDNEAAFTKINDGVIDQENILYADRVTEIPDPVNGTPYLPQTDTLLFIDNNLNGQSSNSFFYALKSIDTNGLSSLLSISTPPVLIPKTTAPPAPVITSIAAGENKIIIRWAINAATAIGGYLLYRTPENKNAGDWRKMELIKTNESDAFTITVGETLPVKEFEFIDITAIARQAYYYGVIAVGLSDEGKWLKSKMSKIKTGQGYDQTPPEPPVWDEVTSGWVYVDDNGIVYEWDADISGAANPVAAIRLVWLENPKAVAVLIARSSSLSSITAVIANWIEGEDGIPGKRFFLDTAVTNGIAYTYSGKSKSAADLKSVNQAIIEIQPST